MAPYMYIAKIRYSIFTQTHLTCVLHRPPPIASPSASAQHAFMIAWEFMDLSPDPGIAKRLLNPTDMFQKIASDIWMTVDRSIQAQQ